MKAQDAKGPCIRRIGCHQIFADDPVDLIIRQPFEHEGIEAGIIAQAHVHRRVFQIVRARRVWSLVGSPSPVPSQFPYDFVTLHHDLHEEGSPAVMNTGILVR